MSLCQHCVLLWEAGEVTDRLLLKEARSMDSSLPCPWLTESLQHLSLVPDVGLKVAGGSDGG